MRARSSTTSPPAGRSPAPASRHHPHRTQLSRGPAAAGLCSLGRLSSGRSCTCGTPSPRAGGRRGDRPGTRGPAVPRRAMPAAADRAVLEAIEAVMASAHLRASGAATPTRCVASTWTASRPGRRWGGCGWATVGPGAARSTATSRPRSVARAWPSARTAPRPGRPRAAGAPGGPAGVSRRYHSASSAA